MATRGRTAKPDAVKNLKSWAARWPTATNLGFDATTHEPAVFAEGGGSQVAKIPWRREADVLTVLASTPASTGGAATAAKARMDQLKEQASTFAAASTEQMREAEAALMEAWRRYDAADPLVRATLRRDVLAAEKQLNELEAAAAAALKKERTTYIADTIKDAGDVIPVVAAYVPVLPVERRGVPFMD